MSKKKYSALKGCPKWVLVAVATAAGAHFGDGADYKSVFKVSEAKRHGGLTFRILANLPTWSLQEVAKAAARRSAGTDSIRAANALTEFERRRLKREGLS